MSCRLQARTSGTGPLLDITLYGRSLLADRAHQIGRARHLDRSVPRPCCCGRWNRSVAAIQNFGGGHTHQERAAAIGDLELVVSRVRFPADDVLVSPFSSECIGMLGRRTVRCASHRPSVASRSGSAQPANLHENPANGPSEAGRRTYIAEVL